MVHGLTDSNDCPENTMTAMRKLTAAAILHEAMLFDNEGHGVFRRGNLQRYLERSADFLETAFRSGLRRLQAAFTTDHVAFVANSHVPGQPLAGHTWDA